MKSWGKYELDDEGLKLRIEHDDFKDLLTVIVHAQLEEGRLDQCLVESLVLIAIQENEAVNFVVHNRIVKRCVPEVVLHG